MADERVVIRIDIDANTSGIDKVQARLRALQAQAANTDQSLGGLNDSQNENARSADRMDKSHRRSSQGLQQHGDAQNALSSKLKKSKKDMDFLDESRKALSKGLESGLKLAAKGAAIEMAALGLAISSVNGLLGIGSFAMKGYKFAMHGLAYAAAAGVAALATFAAAQREYNAALMAFQYKSMPALGAGVNQSMAALRNLTSDSRVAVFGMQNLNAAFSNVSKNAEMTKPIQDALAGIGDFAVAAGGDIGKNFAQAAEFVGLLKKTGSLTQDVMTAAGKVGPQFEKALKESGKTGADEILTLMSSGALAEKAGVKGALEAVNNTLMGQFKSFFTEMQSRFADLGQGFLPDVKKAFEQIQRIVRVTFMRISGEVAGFGTGKLLDDIVKVTDKLADMFVKLFDKYLPKSQQLFGGVGKIFFQMKGWWDSFVKGLNSLSGAGRVLTDAFGPAIQQVFSGLGDSMKMFGTLITENRENFINFGQALATGVKGVQEFFNGFKQVIVANLPIISTLVSGLGTLLGLLGKILGGVSQKGGPFGAITSLAGAIGMMYGISKIAPNSKMGKVGGAIGNRFGRQTPSPAGGGGTSPNGGGGVPGGTIATANMTARIVYLTANKVIDQKRSPRPGRSAPGSGGGTLGAGGGSPLWPGGQDTGMMHGPEVPTKWGGRYNHFKNFATWVDPGLGYGSPNAKWAAVSKGNKGISKLVNSRGAGASIGAGVGLAAMSHFANEDANPALAAGGMLAMYNPLAGLAVGGLGTAATAKTAKGGAVSGALGGAAAGAVIGTALGGPVVGTAIGAALGVGFGATMGYLNRIAGEKDAARGAAREQSTGKFGSKAVADLYAFGPEMARKSVDEMRAKNDRMQTIYRQFKETEGSYDRDNKLVVEQMKQNGIALSQEEERLLKTEPALGSFFRSYQKQTEGMTELGEKGFDKFSEQTKQLAGITGKTEKEIRGLALGMGVDLMDTTKTLADNLKALGLATAKTADELKSFSREVYVKGFEQVFGRAKKFQQSQSALNQAAEGIRQTGKGTTSEQTTDFVSTLYEQALTLNKGDAAAASSYLKRTLFGSAGASDKLAGTAFQNIKAPLYNLESIFQQVLIGDEQGRTIQRALLETIAENTKTSNTAVATNALVAAGGKGLQVAGGNAEELRTRIANQMEVLQAAIDNPYAVAFKERNQEALAKLQGFGQTLTMSGLQGEDLANLAERELASVGIVTDFMTQSAGEELSSMAKEVEDAIVKSLGTSPDWMKGTTPEWYKAGNNPVWYDIPPNWANATTPPTVPDTSSPRIGRTGDTVSSRLGRTMARHSSFDAMLVGNRTVTSSWRNTNLGSPSSDHVTGNAYDLVGQNLGAYSRLVNTSGGFAEFHGSAGSRHLHVVPGDGPIGDTMNPVVTGIGAMSGATNNYSYQIVINPNLGQDPAAIANEVMIRIAQKERSDRERA